MTTENEPHEPPESEPAAEAASTEPPDTDTSGEGEAPVATIFEDEDFEDNPHWLRRLMDNHWLLLLLGVVIPTISYTIWGWIDLLLTKPAELP
jgi:hypothetical protein